MTDRIIDFALQQRLLVLVAAVLVLGAGVWSYLRLPVDAYPDISPALVQVFTETEGLAPEEVEQLVTYPVEVAMNGLPGLERIRSVSNFNGVGDEPGAFLATLVLMGEELPGGMVAIEAGLAVGELLPEAPRGDSKSRPPQAGSLGQTSPGRSPGELQPPRGWHA